MADPTHTPGPWRLHEDYPQVIVAAAEPTLSLLGLKIESGREDNPIAQVARIEDARLMAAAPELRDALVLALPWMERRANRDVAVIMQAAIAKAEGRCLCGGDCPPNCMCDCHAKAEGRS